MNSLTALLSEKFIVEMDLELGLRLIISFILGAAIGLEREFHSKAAGLRTMIMICLGSTIFTEISIVLGVNTPDRIASNIVTGVGFLGAGVIFRDGLTITGITTATTIWISAALGMAVGAGEYFIAIVSTGVVIIVLSFFNRVQKLVERLNQTRTYKISTADQLENEIPGKTKELRLKCSLRRVSKDEKGIFHVYEVSGSASCLDDFTEFLKRSPRVISFDY